MDAPTDQEDAYQSDGRLHNTRHVAHEVLVEQNYQTSEQSCHLQNKPYRIENLELSYDDAVTILLAPNLSSISTAPAVLPQGGQVFVYALGKHNETEFRKMRCDRYMWNNRGKKLLRGKSGATILRKTYWSWRKADGECDARFRRQEYRLESSNQDQSFLIMQYLGDATIAQPRPHGNSVANTRPHVRNMPYVKDKVLPEHEFDDAIGVYRNLIKNHVPGHYQAVMMPRNLKQIQNAQHTARLAHRIGHDALYNVVLLSKQLPNFIHHFKLLDGFSLVLADTDLLSHLGTAIGIAALGGKSMFQLQYDTTFNMGDFYVSPLLLKYQIFDGCPCIPVAYHIHEFKHLFDHKVAFEVLKKQCKQLGSAAQIPLVTDREFNFAQVLPSAKQLYCWNHLKQDVRRQLKNIGASIEQTNFLVDQFGKLLDSETLEEFREMYNESKQLWPADYLAYFDKHILDDIVQSAGRWVLEPLGVYFPSCGVTTNGAEGLNSLLKRFTNHKELPIDALILCLFRLSQYYRQEITRGIYGLGNYKLKKEFDCFARPSEELPTQAPCISPEEIVDAVKGGFTKQISLDYQEKPIADCLNDTNSLDDALAKDHVTAVDRAAMSQLALAQEAKDHVEHVPKLNAFMVKGTDLPRTVTLFPKETCSCPATRTCYHIMAVKLSIGMDAAANHGKLNLTLAKKNSLKRAEKRSGKKAIRKVDVADRIISAADDSLLMSDQLSQPPVTSSPKPTLLNKGKDCSKIFRAADKLRPEDYGLYGEIRELSENKSNSWSALVDHLPKQAPKRARNENGLGVEIIQCEKGAPKSFSFSPVAAPWMKRKCSLLGLLLSDTRPRHEALMKTATESPPSSTQPIEGDGNCLFRSLSHVITSTEAHHKRLRQAICRQIASNPTKYLASETADSYLRRSGMMNDCTWGTDKEISAAADLLQTTVWCYGPTGQGFAWTEFAPDSNEEPEHAIFIVNRHSHFEPLYKW